MRFFHTSLTLVGFTFAAVLAGCDSGSSTADGMGGATGSSGAPAASTGGNTQGGGSTRAGAAGTSAVGSSGTSGTAAGGTAGVSSGIGGTSTGGTSAGGTSSGGTSTSTGGTSTGGTSTTGGAGPDVDQMGKANAAPGTTTSTVQDYLRLGEIRLINNNWGSAKLNCNAPMSVFINQDKSFGWTFNRGACGGSNQDPDFPQLEFGIHPFGIGSSLATSPNFSSTTLLPLQVKDITTASVTLDSLNLVLQKEGSWDLTFEFWLSKENPATTQSDAGVYSELMTFWGWQNGRYPEAPNGTGPVGTGAGTDMISAGKTYKLEVQNDQWSNGQWRYFQFRDTAGPNKSFSGTVNIKALIDYLVTKKGYSTDYWVSRFEVGTEIDDNTQGTATMKNATFEVNGQSRSVVFGTK